MKKSVATVGALLVSAALLAGGAAYASITPAPRSAAEASASDASVATRVAADLADERGGFSLAHESGVTTGSPLTTIAAAPVAATLDVAVDPTEIEQYWFWASGVKVTATGLQPGESARVSVTFASGETRRWAPVSASSEGTLDTTVRSLDIDPENLYPETGLTRITVESASGATGAAFVTIVPNANEVLQVSADPTAITRDAFLDESVTVRASGFVPLEKVYFNLGSPDLSFQAVGETEGLHADENGAFEYVLQAVSVNSQLGTYILGIQGVSGRTGTGTFEVVEGAPREDDKTFTLAATTISQADFSGEPGLAFTVRGFVPFDSYTLELTTPRGVEIDLGAARTNGEGVGDNAVKAPVGAPVGEYVLVARATTTGDFARTTFTVTGDAGQPQATIRVEPQTISADALADADGGITVSATGLEPRTSARISLRDADFARAPLLAGADVWINADDNGEFRVSLVTLETVAPGPYTVWAEIGGGVTGFDLKVPITVTEDPSGADPDAATDVPSTVSPTRSPAPQPSTPGGSTAPTAPATPVPGPAETETPDILPPAEGDIFEERFTDDGIVVPQPPQPTLR